MTWDPPLPRRMRARLAYQARVDGLAAWLIARGHWRAATRLWKITGSW